VPAAPVTLPTVSARSSTLRLLSGISTIWRSVIVWPGVPDPRLMSGASAATVTSVVTSPRVSVSLRVVVVAVSTFTRWTTALLNPVKAAVTRYSTGSSSGAEKVPDSDVLSSMTLVVPMLVIVTVASATTDPVWSKTVPLIAP
jgi:hypothetical protein